MDTNVSIAGVSMSIRDAAEMLGMNERTLGERIRNERRKNAVLITCNGQEVRLRGHDRLLADDEPAEEEHGIGANPEMDAIYEIYDEMRTKWRNIQQEQRRQAGRLLAIEKKLEEVWGIK